MLTRVSGEADLSFKSVSKRVNTKTKDKDANITNNKDIVSE